MSTGVSRKHTRGWQTPKAMNTVFADMWIVGELIRNPLWKKAGYHTHFGVNMTHKIERSLLSPPPPHFRRSLVNLLLLVGPTSQLNKHIGSYDWINLWPIYLIRFALFSHFSVRSVHIRLCHLLTEKWYFKAHIQSHTTLRHQAQYERSKHIQSQLTFTFRMLNEWNDKVNP